MRPLGRRAHGRAGSDLQGRRGFPSSKKKVLTGKRFLVTAGPCREYIDPVRYISNRSSGKMGYALAAAARTLGADVVLVSGPTSLPDPSGVTVERVETTQQMYEAVQRHFGSVDCLIMAAAPADFTPIHSHVDKVKKSSAGLNVELKPTVDILKAIAPHKRSDQRVIGFALETNDGLANARKKLTEKQLDMIVLNNATEAGAGFDTDTNIVTILRPNFDPREISLRSKSQIAALLLDEIAAML